MSPEYQRHILEELERQRLIELRKLENEQMKPCPYFKKAK